MLHKDFVGLLEGVRGPRDRIISAATTLYEKKATKDLFGRTLPIANHIVYASGTLVPDRSTTDALARSQAREKGVQVPTDADMRKVAKLMGKKGKMLELDEPVVLLRNCGGPARVMENVRKARELLEMFGPTIEEEAAKVDFKELEKREERFRSLRRMYNRLMFGAAILVPAALALTSFLQGSPCSEGQPADAISDPTSWQALKTVLYGVGSVFAIFIFREGHDYLANVDTGELRRAIDDLKGGISSLREQLDTIAEAGSFYSRGR